MDDAAYNEEAGHNLRVEMVRARMTQADLAAKVGISVVTVSRHINGHVAMPLVTLDRYARALGIDPAMLLPRLDSNQQPAGYGMAAA